MLVRAKGEVVGWRVAIAFNLFKGHVLPGDVHLLEEILVLFCTSGGFQQTRETMH
jgi:hypothetical protein